MDEVLNEIDERIAEVTLTCHADDENWDWYNAQLATLQSLKGWIVNRRAETGCTSGLEEFV